LREAGAIGNCRNAMNALDPTRRIIRAADLAATFVFAIEGALAAVYAGLDPVGVTVLAFLAALGGGLMRDVLLGTLPPAAVADWHYAVIVLAAAAAAWTSHAFIAAMPPGVLVTLDAMGLTLAMIAGTEKSIDRGIHPLVCVFIGAINGAGGGVLRDVAINVVPRVLRVDIYASAAMFGAAIIAFGRLAGLSPRVATLLGGLGCFGLRIAAVHFGWQLPTAG
jgi:uncharacterized membrane protein YeiH